MTWTLADDKRAYKWARKREAEILQARQRIRLLYPLAIVTKELRWLQEASRLWRIRAACLERDEHLGLPD